jgi:hypothetical protein
MKDPFADEEQRIISKRGKWSQRGVPHKGWTCIDIEDLGKPELECEMCESTSIRYVHYMQHADYPQVLGAGCVCAGHMESDVTAARSREASMQSRVTKRKRWTTRKWRISAKGNPWITADGYRVTVYQRGGRWAATVSTEDNSVVNHSRRNYSSMNHAKLAAFDEITRLLSREKA